MFFGLCFIVGLVGGYIQGGGYFIFISKYGFLVDNVFEWEVVIVNGIFVIVILKEN